MTGRRRRGRWAALAAVAVITLAGGACGGSEDGGDDAGGGGRGGLRVTSAAFADGGRIPERFSCEGENVSPPLAWSGVPAEAVEIAVIVTDPEAPDGPFFHWLLLGLEPGRAQLAAGEVPGGATQAAGSSENPTYIGMCPPRGEEHEYRFTVHALDEPFPSEAASRPPAEVARLVEDRTIASGTLTGRYRG